MGTVTTSTNTNPILYSGHTRIDYDDGTLWVLVLNGSGNIELSRSTNNGSSWAVVNTLARTGLQDVTMYVPVSGSIHVAYRTNESSQDRVYWRRYDLVLGTWSSEILVASASNGGVAAAIYSGLDLVVVGAYGAEYVAIAAGTVSGASHGITLKGVFRPANNGTPRLAPDMFAGPTLYLQPGTGRLGPTLDIEHTGDGKTALVPHLWVTFGRARINVFKAGWTGWGWDTPNSSYIMVSSVPAQNSIRGSWDGRRHLTASVNPNATTTVCVYERNRSHTGATTVRTTAAHTQGVVRSCSVSYDYNADDLRVYAVGTSTADLYYTTYDRSAGTWSAWAVVTTTDVLGATPENYSVRRNAYGNAQFDVIIAHTGAPNTIVHYPVTQAYSPNQPTWAIQGGIAMWTSTPLTLDWNFSDVDAADVQTAYALRRQVGNDTVEYWRASDGTWQPTEQKNLSATSAVALPAGFVDRFDIINGVGSLGVVTGGTVSHSTAQHHSGDHSALHTVSGSPATATAYARVGWAPALNTVVGAWIYSPAGWASFTMTLRWLNAALGTISTSSAVVGAVPAGTWVYRTHVATSPALTAHVEFGMTISGTPPNGTLTYMDDLTLSLTTTPWASPNDDNHTYYVKVWDSTDLPSIYSSGITFIPSELYPPTLVTPAAAAVVTGDALTATWTVGQQGSYRIRLWKSGVLELDTGFVAGAVLSYDVPVTLVDSSSYTIGITTRNSEGLQTLEDVHAFTTNFDEPATPALAFTPSTSGGYIRVVITNPTPAGPQPAVLSQDLFRRLVGDTSTGIRVAAGLASGATYDDWTAASGIAYEYRSLVRGVNGASQYSAWTA
jgi:hypothetical protein